MSNAIWGGLNPGFVIDPRNRPYPVREVWIVCQIITAESALLFAIIRPFSLARPRRVWLALAVFVPIEMVDNGFFSGWSDQPGHYYSNGIFLFFTNVFLFISAVVTHVVFRRRAAASVKC